MNYSGDFLFSNAENSCLNFRGLGLANNELDECISIFESTMERHFIKNIKLCGNNLHHYDCNKILKIFPRIQNIYVSNISDIDLSNETRRHDFVMATGQTFYVCRHINIITKN